MLRLITRVPIVMSLLLASSGCARPETNKSADTEEMESVSVADVIATGQFVDKGGQHTSGMYTIERVGEDLQLVLGEDFQTDEGPDLHVVLTPTLVVDAGNDNAMVEGAEIVGALSLQSGRQVYDLPDDLSLDSFNSVVIHCIEYSHLYGAAPLR